MNLVRGGLVDVVTSAERRKLYLSQGYWDATTLPAKVDFHAANEPGRVAIVDLEGRRRITYGELASRSRQVAALLLARGVGIGDVVSVQLPNFYETIAIDIGVLRVGAVLNPLVPTYGVKETAHMLRVGKTRLIFVPSQYRSNDYRQRAEQLKDMGLETEHIFVADPNSTADPLAEILTGFEPADCVARDASWVSELIFTSGTESAPKAVMHTEQTTSFAVRATASFLGLGTHDVVFMPSPVGHSTGLNYGARVALHLGLRLVLLDRWDPVVAINLCAAEKASYTSVATTFLKDMLSALRSNPVDLSSFRFFGCAGAPIPAATVEQAEREGITVLRGYGSTETLGVTKNHPNWSSVDRIETDGKPVPGIELELRSDDGQVLEPGSVGEVFVRSPGTSVGFALDMDRTSRTFGSDGWVRTGDLGVVGDTGSFRIVGRKKEIIIRGGMNVAPSEIEELLRAHPAISDAAVLGLPDDRLGETICAFVEINSGAAAPSNSEVLAYLSEQGLSRFKLPSRVEFVAQLPRTATGKVQKAALFESLSKAD